MRDNGTAPGVGGPIGVALFGAGRIGRVHAQSIADCSDARLAWVCDPDVDAARTVGERHGARWSADPAKALDDPAVDAVVVASATPTHVDLLRASVLAGRSVLCEKPIDLDLRRVDDCWAEIAHLRPPVMVGFNRRFDPSVMEVHRRVAAGEIGRLRALRITSRDPQPPSASYLAQSGGIFRDMTIHDFDLARFFLGEIVEVQAMASDDDDPVLAGMNDHAQVVVTLRGRDGALCTIVNSRRCAFGYDQRIEAFGDLGAIETVNMTATVVRASNAYQTNAAGRALDFFLERYGPAYRAELAEFIAATREGREPAVCFADGRAALVLAEAAAESVATRRVVPIAHA
jgi:myo-inositol 2-dehydrogenase / D-chiro-inositol 1-dehydrogenase